VANKIEMFAINNHEVVEFQIAEGVNLRLKSLTSTPSRSGLNLFSVEMHTGKNACATLNFFLVQNSECRKKIVERFEFYMKI